MQTVNIHEAKSHLSRFVDQATADEEIVIARAGHTVGWNPDLPVGLGIFPNNSHQLMSRR